MLKHVLFSDLWYYYSLLDLRYAATTLPPPTHLPCSDFCNLLLYNTKDNTTLSQMSLLKGEEGCHFKMAFLDSAFGKDEDDKGKGIQGI